MILLYAASTTYHTLDISPKINQILRKLDHRHDDFYSDCRNLHSGMYDCIRR